MTAVRGRGNVGPVNDPDTTSIAVRIEPSEPPTGEVTGPDGRTHAFSGWLALALAVERACGSSPPSIPPQGEAPR